MLPILSPEQRSRFAASAAELLALPQICATLTAEIEATLEEHPELPRTEEAKRVLWGVAFSQLSRTALISGAEQAVQPQEKTA